VYPVNLCTRLFLKPSYSLFTGRQHSLLLDTSRGRCRSFTSVSVFGFWSVFISRFGIRYRFLRISDIGSGFRLICQFGNPGMIGNEQKRKTGITTFQYMFNSNGWENTDTDTDIAIF